MMPYDISIIGRFGCIKLIHNIYVHNRKLKFRHAGIIRECIDGHVPGWGYKTDGWAGQPVTGMRFVFIYHWVMHPTPVPFV